MCIIKKQLSKMSGMTRISMFNKFNALAIDSDDESDSSISKSFSDIDSKISSFSPKGLSSFIPKPKSITSTMVKDKNELFKKTIGNIVFQEIPKNCERFFGCYYCDNDHCVRKCNHFKKLKDNVSFGNYISDDKLKSYDEAGFCAAGIIPYFVDKNNNKWVLMLIETRATEYNKTRDYIPGLNFIAGGRECVKNTSTNVIVVEQSYETALNEFKEELSEILTEDSFKLLQQEIIGSSPTFVSWTGKIKMALYGVEIKTDLRESLVLDHNSESKNTEAQNFRWINLSEYNKYVYEYNSGSITNAGLKFHKFTKFLVEQIVRDLNK
jgi:hypothetical protein